MLKINLPDPAPLDQIIPTDIDILLYGAGKTGKTLLAASFAHEGPVLILDTGKGSLSLKTNPDIITPELRENIFIQKIPRYDSSARVVIPTGWAVCEAIMDSLEKTGEFAGVKPRTLVLDEATAASEMALQAVLYAAKKSLDASSLLPVTQPEWGSLRKRMINFILKGRGLTGINFIFITHQLYVKDEDSGAVLEILPNVVGKLAWEISAYFDETYYCRTQPRGTSQDFMLHTRPFRQAIAGSRLNLPSPLANSYESLKEAINKVTT